MVSPSLNVPTCARPSGVGDKRVPVDRTRQPGIAQVRWQFCDQSLRQLLTGWPVGQRQEHTGPRTRHAGGPEFPKPCQCLADLWIERAGGLFEIVPKPRRAKIAYCEGGCERCQFKVLEHARRRRVDAWPEQQDGRFRQFDRGELFADALRKGRMAGHEYRHVRPELQGEFRESLPRPVEVPKLVERDQRAGRVGAAAAQAAAERNAFRDTDVRAKIRSAFPLEQLRGTHDEVRFRRHALVFAHAADLPVAPRFDRERIGQLEKLKYRLKQVIAVRPAADDVQEEIDLGRGGPLGRSLGAAKAMDGRERPRVPRRHCAAVPVFTERRSITSRAVTVGSSAFGLSGYERKTRDGKSPMPSRT